MSQFFNSHEISYTEATRAYLRIRGFAEDPDLISIKLPIAGSRFWKKGQQLTPRKTNGAADNGWELQSALPDDHELTDHVKHLIDLIRPYKAVLESITDAEDQLSFELVCVIQGDNANPSFSLGNNLLKEVAMLGFSLEVDIYAIE